MKIDDWLSKATKKLRVSNINTARLDCLVLLEDATGKDRSWLLANTKTLLQGRTLEMLEKQIQRRKEHEPLAYIRGKSEFYGREFIVNAHTLEPRPETETMIDLLKNIHYKDGPCNVIDVGTGSGCLAVTAKLEFPSATVYATDIDKRCVETAKQNAKKLGANVSFFNCYLLEAVPSTDYHLPTTILANLPYVPDSHTINQAAMFEPNHAIFGGPDGLNLYRRLFKQITKLSEPPQYVLTESLPFQHKELVEIATSASYKNEETADFIQLYKLSST